MQRTIRAAHPAAVLLAAAVLSAPAKAQDFPAGSVTVQVINVASCMNITGPGTVTNATANLNGANLDIVIPAGGIFTKPAQITIQNIPQNTSGTAPVFMSGAEILNGSGVASLNLQNGVPTDFSLGNTPLSMACSADVTASGTPPQAAGTTSTAPPPPSNTVVQADVALAALRHGPLADTSRAVGQGLQALAGLGGPRALSLGPGQAGFSTRGMAAGSHTLPIAVWGNAGYTSSDDDGVTTASKSDRAHVTLGADVAVTDKVLLGVAGGYEVDDRDTLFNGGNIESDGFTLVAYAGALLTDNLSADVALGRSELEIDQFRTTAGTRITSTLDGDRTYAAANVNYGRELREWLITGRAGALWARDKQEAFTESDGTVASSSKFSVGRFNLGAEVARSFGVLEPFVSATYNHSFNQTRAAPGQRSADRSDVLLGVGARFYGSDTVSGALEVNTLLGHDNVDEHSLNLLIRANF